MITRLPLHHQLSNFAWLWGTLCLLSVTTVSAQLAHAPPIPVTNMAYATIDEKTLYVHGGWVRTTFTTQFFSLDLTQDSWDVSSPPWRQLTYPNSEFDSVSYGHSMSVSPDGRTLTVWIYSAETIVVNYSVTDNRWTRLPIKYENNNAARAVTDPTTGTVYIPAGTVAESAVRSNDLVKYNVASGISVEVIPSSVVIPQPGYLFVWSKVRKSFILYTGFSNTTNPFYEYTPSNGKWKGLHTTGSIPRFKTESCMVPGMDHYMQQQQKKQQQQTPVLDCFKSDCVEQENYSCF
ncbi:MAG: hypothetical protein J3R72DRAFT_455962 [Linnemannia gamsii]|nr:MAG: hypothetical protein J3R72DRAFT_455962 [Linnemannia gamsii]